MPELLQRLHADTLRQLDEQGWIIAAEDADCLHLVSDVVGAPRYAFVRLTLRAGADLVAVVEVFHDGRVVDTVQFDGSNIANLLDTALEHAERLLSRSIERV